MMQSPGRICPARDGREREGREREGIPSEGGGEITVDGSVETVCTPSLQRRPDFEPFQAKSFQNDAVIAGSQRVLTWENGAKKIKTDLVID